MGQHAQRLVEAERHVPGLAGEDREDRRELCAQYAAGKQQQEEGHGKRDVTEHRHRLQDVEHGHQQFFGAPAFGGQGAVEQGEDQRRDHRREHAQGGAHRIFRQVGGVEGNDLALQRLDGGPGFPRSDGKKQQKADHQRQGDQIPTVGQQAHGGCWYVVTEHFIHRQSFLQRSGSGEQWGELGFGSKDPARRGGRSFSESQVAVHQDDDLLARFYVSECYKADKFPVSSLYEKRPGGWLPSRVAITRSAGSLAGCVCSSSRSSRRTPGRFPRC